MRYLLFLLLFNSVSLAISQAETEIVLTGSVADKETKEALEYATVSLHHAVTDSIINGGATNAQGRFRLTIAPGTYTLKVQFLSFKTFVLKSKSFQDHLNLGRIELIPDNSLQEVELTIDKSLMESKFNKRIYNASRDPANIGGNALDVLNNTPTVRVSDEGDIIVRGGSSTLLIDGKPQFELAELSDILNALPANSIDRVEIITRSAKYSADGGGGSVINIITKKRIGIGTNGSIEIHGGIPDNHGFSSFFNEDTDKMNLYSTISFNHGDREKYTNIRQPLLSFDQRRIDKRQKNSLLFNLGSDFYLGDNNVLAASFLINAHDKNNRSQLDEPDFIRNVDESDNGSRIELNVGNTTKFDDKGHELAVNLNYVSSDSDSDSEINEDQGISSIFQKALKDQTLDNFTARVDYTVPLSENSSLELGYQGTFRFYNNDFNVSQFDPTLNDFVTVNNLDAQVGYDEFVQGFYGVFNGSYNQFSMALGLRSETSAITLEQLGINDVKKNYTDLFPSVTLGYAFNDSSNLTLNYARSIDRPSAAQINPFISYTDERFQTVGNQNLNPYYTDYFELLFDQSFKKLNLATSLFINSASDQFLTVIENTGLVTDDGQEIFRRTTVNSGDKNIVGVDLDLTYRFSKNFRLNTYISPYYLEVKNTIDPAYENSNVTWYASARATWSINNGLRLRADHIYQSPINTGLTVLRTINTSNIAVSKDLFKKRATLSFRINDLFSSKEFSYQSLEASTITRRDARFQNQYLLSFTYRLNQFKRNSKNRSGDINKDDLEDNQDKKL